MASCFSVAGPPNIVAAGEARSTPGFSPGDHGGSYASAADRTPWQPESGVGSATGPQQQQQQQGPASSATPSGTDAGSAPRKRKAGPGSRGVANLTAEQLARKRANDREAQRAIRERQRLRTEQYEREIGQLKAQRPYQELQAVLRQKEAVEAELADVKRRLAAIVAMIQPVLSSPPSSSDHHGWGRDGSAAGPSPPAASPGAAATPALPAPPIHNPVSTPTSTTTSPASVAAHGPWQTSLSHVSHRSSIDAQPQLQPSPEMGVLNQQRSDLAHALDLGSDRLGLDFLLDTSRHHKIPRIRTGIDGAQDSPQFRHVPMKHDWTAATSVLPGMQAQAQAQSSAQSSPIYSQAMVPSVAAPPPPLPPTPTSTTTTEPPPLFSLLPRNIPPTCPLDSILLDFLSERRQRAADGLSQSEIAGPRYPSVSSLLNPAVSVYSHPLSKVFTDILVRFPSLATLPERVAVLYLMFLFMRWQVAPTRENYERLPPWFRPVRNQTERPHPAWFDHLPFPRMREKLVAEYEPGGFPFDNFFVPFTSTLSLNWPYEDALVLLANPAGDELMINPVFEQHLAVLENWTLGDAFYKAHPALRGTYNWKKGS